MACPAIQTGNQFLGTTLAHLDCQGRTIGAYGYGALADPGSTLFAALTGLLTIFIALFAIRMMLGERPGLQDVAGSILRVGIVLTLATSWPAWRVLGYDLVLDAPAEIAQAVGSASGLPGGKGNMIARLQNADDGIVAMTVFGSGRLTGGVVGGSDLGDSFNGVALADSTGLGWGRVLFLIATIGPYAIVRVGAGLLLAVAPVMAALLLFNQSMALFAGWLRGLVFTALGSLSLAICQGVELALLDPWISDVLATRQNNTFTPAAPTELIVLALASCVLSFGVLALIARVSFMPQTLLKLLQHVTQSGREALPPASPAILGGDRTIPLDTASRAQVIAAAVSTTMRREDSARSALQNDANELRGGSRIPAADARGAPVGQAAEPLGSSFRLARRRSSSSNQRRDGAK